MWFQPSCDNGVEVTCASVRFLRAHKWWTVLTPPHWRNAQSEGALRAEPCTTTKQQKQLQQQQDFQWQSGGQKWRAHPLPEVAHTEPRRGHKCERERLRCTQTKLAAHLECRSHQWKMPTSYPNFSSGKTILVCVSSVWRVKFDWFGSESSRYINKKWSLNDREYISVKLYCLLFSLL